MLHEFASTDLSDEELLQRRFHDRRQDQKGQAQLDPAMDVGRWALFGRSQPQRRQNTLRPNPRLDQRCCVRMLTPPAVANAIQIPRP